MADPQTAADPKDAEAAKQRQDEARPAAARQQNKSDELAASQRQTADSDADDDDKDTVPVSKLVAFYKKHAPKVAGNFKAMHEIEERNIQLPSAEHKNANKSAHDSFNAMEKEFLEMIPKKQRPEPQPQEGGQPKKGN